MIEIVSNRNYLSEKHSKRRIEQHDLPTPEVDTGLQRLLSIGLFGASDDRSLPCQFQHAELVYRLPFALCDLVIHPWLVLATHTFEYPGVEQYDFPHPLLAAQRL